MKKKYLLLLEDHKSGAFKKGDIIMIDESSVEVWMETGIVEESTKKAYTKLKEDQANAILEANKEAAKKHYEKQQETAPNHTGQDVNEETDNEDENETLGNGGATTEGSEGGSEGSNESSNDGGGSQSGTGEVLKHYKLTEDDLTEEPELTEGFAVGNEIEIDENGTWMLGEDGKLILKEVITE